MQQEIERRSQKRSRDAAQAKDRTINGYGARFDVPTSIAEQYIEVIRRGAFSRAIRQKQDCKFLVNHNPDHIIARVANNTLELAEDSLGLRFKANVASTSIGDDLLENLKTQNWSSCSFSFSVPQGGDRWTQVINGNTGRRCDQRELLDLDLWDCSVVTFPQYSGTSAVRDIDEDNEEDEDNEPLVTLAAAASSSRSMPVEVRSRIMRVVDESRLLMTPEERAIYTRALMLEIKADR